jgi:hypothetical protein
MRTYTVHLSTSSQAATSSAAPEASNWGQVSTTLDDARDLPDLYQRLASLRFVLCEELTCRLGGLRLYRRPSSGRRSNFPYHYCCVLYVGDFGEPVLLHDLPDVFGLMAEIDAHPKEEKVAAALDAITELRVVLAQLTDHLDEPPLSAIRLAAELQTPLTQGVALLREIKMTLLGGQKDLAEKAVPEIEPLPLSPRAKSPAARKQS